MMSILEVKDPLNTMHILEEDINLGEALVYAFDAFAKIICHKVSHGLINEKGHRVGKWILYNQTKTIRGEGSFVDGSKDGLWTYYFEGYSLLFKYNGYKYAEGYYANGLQTGAWAVYYLNGQLRETCSYTNGKLNGQFNAWFKDGESQSKGSYNNDLKVGYWYTKHIHKYAEYTSFMIEYGNYVNGHIEGIWTVNVDGEIRKYDYNKKI